MTEFVHQVDLPQPGGSINTWGSELNVVFDSVLHKIAEFGPQSQILEGGRLEAGTPDLRENQLFVATDNSPNTLHRYNGNEWVTIYDASDFEDNGGSSFDPERWNVIDVSDHGFDGTRSGDIVQFMIDNGPGRFIFPEGDYSIEQSLDVHAESWEQFAIIGLGSGADFHFENESTEEFIHTGYDSTDLQNATLKNFDLHVDPDNGIDAGFGRFAAHESLVMEDIELVGKRTYHSLHSDTGGPGTNGIIYNLRINMLNPDSVANLQNVRFMDGGEGDDRPRVIPYAVEPPNEGTQLYTGCHVAAFQGNGFYLKDGTGSSILLGCSGTNVGGQAFRYGQQDMSIAGRTTTNDDLDGMDHTAGTHIDIHRAEGTAIIGHRSIDTRGEGEIIRVRHGNEQASVRDVYIHSTGTNRMIRASSSGTGDDSVDTHGDGKLVFENIRIIVESDMQAATYQGAVESRRANTVYRNLSIDIDVPNTWYAAAVVQHGDAHFKDCRFRMADDNGAPYNVTIGPDDSSEDRVGRIEFSNCDFDAEVGMYQDDQIPILSFVGCDFTDVSDPWYNVSPLDHNGIDDLTIFRNPGLDEQIINNNPVGVATNSTSNSLTVEFGDDVLEFSTD